jgi:hypothetical protein
LAGFPGIADRLWRDRGKPGGIEARMAFYGHLFLTPGQQGDEPAPFTPEEEVFAEALALEWLQHAAERATKEKIRQSGALELAFVKQEMGAEQGMGRYARSAANSLAKISWFWPYGFGFAERFVNRALAQVTRYLAREDIRATALKSVTDLIGPETKIIIGHSLGSVVAFEAAHFLCKPLPLFLTLGSPLGLQNIVYQRLRPQPPVFPPQVQRWVNIADRDDLVAAEPNLEVLFRAGQARWRAFRVRLHGGQWRRAA